MQFPRTLKEAQIMQAAHLQQISPAAFARQETRYQRAGEWKGDYRVRVIVASAIALFTLVAGLYAIAIY
jgi:hypothetical protein